MITADRFARVAVRHLSLPTRRSLAAAHDAAPSPDRELVVVEVETTDGVVGWGECSALNAPTYTHEWAADSYERLTGWADAVAAVDPAAFPMTAASIEMAAIDAELVAEGRSLADHLGVIATEVLAGASIGLAPLDESIAIAKELIEQGYRRLKIKIEPSRVDDVAHELSHVLDHRSADLPPIELQVDANGSLNGEHFLDLLRLVDHGVTVIEQPFAVDRPDLAAEFITGCDAIVMADEAVNGVADAVALRDQGAVGAVAIKPPRVGGIDAAVELLTWCRDNGVPASVGGMLESGLGRHALAAVAGLDGFTITGDLSPASQFLAADPWPDLAFNNGTIAIPTAPGVAPRPDLDLLALHTVRQHEARR